MLPLSDHDRIDRLERAIAARLLSDDDPPEICKHIGCSLELANAVREAPEFVEE